MKMGGIIMTRAMWDGDCFCWGERVLYSKDGVTFCGFTCSLRCFPLGDACPGNIRTSSW
uniref:Uncharacterized protein n=1 Tax=Arundo donax TaxID=35708 RepID=A0A0A9E7L8_ARUDO